MSNTDLPLAEDFDCSDFSHGGVSHPVWRSGAGPGVIIMHEIPGIIPEVTRFARTVRDAGFTVFLPEMFGKVDKPFSQAYAAAQVIRACISREFTCLALGRSSPITVWLRALCRHAHDELGGPGVGALGMCLTGNFALALMLEPSVIAPVLSQPSLPFAVGKKRSAALHLSDEELLVVQRRVKDEGVPVVGLRFTADPACPPERFKALREALGSGFEEHSIHNDAHSVLTRHLVNEEGHPTRAALDRVLQLFNQRLKTS